MSDPSPIYTHLPPPSLAGLDPLDALSAAHAIPGDLAFLHSGVGSGLSVLGLHPRCRIVIEAGDQDSPLPAFERALNEISFDSPHPLVGWLGCISYDIGRTLEHIPSFAADDLRWPLIAFTLFDHYLVFHQPTGALAGYSLGQNSFPWNVFQSVPGPVAPPGPPRWRERQTRASYLDRIRRVQEYIAAGDIYQANLAQRWVLDTHLPGDLLFRRLASESPAPYAAYLRLGPREAISASPELFLTLDQGHAVTRPIKGTRPRAPGDPHADAALRTELEHAVKDRAELAMIVDLLRNDLGRVSKYGTVKVTEPRTLEQHPTVWHTVATIESNLRPDKGLADLLAAVCPGGSITGAPKIRAMQIIEELEGFRRNLYCGNIGVLGSGGKSLALNIAIRTILLQDGKAHLFAGGGIVADSDPVAEYEETLHKAAAMFRALGAPLPADQG